MGKTKTKKKNNSNNGIINKQYFQINYGIQAINKAIQHVTIKTPWQSPISKEDRELCKSLIIESKNPHILPKYGNTALIDVVNSNDVELCRLLLEHASVKYINHNSNSLTALKCAVGNGNIEICKMLIEHGANLNPLKDYPFRTAVSCNKIETCKLLFENGADINVKTFNETLLHTACRFKHFDIAKWLVENMAYKTVFCLNKTGHSAYQVWGLLGNQNPDEIKIEDENIKELCDYIENMFVDML